MWLISFLCINLTFKYDSVASLSGL